MTTLLLLGLLAASLPSATRAWSCNDAGATTNLTIQWLDKVDPGAVCNDGSKAAFYFSPATSKAKQNLWLIYLAGGGQAYDEASLEARWSGSAYPHHNCSTSTVEAPCFMSSKDFPPTCGKTGIFDSAAGTKNPMAGANLIYVPYCTSDAHVGDAKVGRFEMRGQRVVSAVLRAAQTELGLGRATTSMTASTTTTTTPTRTTVVFGGGSAGGRGSMMWLDRARAELPRQVKVVGFLDSAYYIDLPALPASKFMGFADQTKAFADNFNASGVVDAACAEAYGGMAAWRCLFGQYRMPFLRTPYLLVAGRYDGWQLSHDVHGYDGIEASPTYAAGSEAGYVDGFGRATTALLSTLPAAPAVRAGSSIYSTACYSHHVSEKELFWTMTTTDGVSEADALRTFLAEHRGEDDARTRRGLKGKKVGTRRAGAATSHSWVDRCDGYECGKGCPSLK